MKDSRTSSLFFPIGLTALLVCGYLWGVEALAQSREAATPKIASVGAVREPPLQSIFVLGGVHRDMMTSNNGPQASTITFWHAYNGARGEIMSDFVAEFQAAYPDITVAVETNASSRALFDEVMAA